MRRTRQCSAVCDAILRTADIAAVVGPAGSSVSRPTFRWRSSVPARPRWSHRSRVLNSRRPPTSPSDYCIIYSLGFAVVSKRRRETVVLLYFSALSKPIDLLANVISHSQRHFSSKPWSVFRVRAAFGSMLFAIITILLYASLGW